MTRLREEPPPENRARLGQSPHDLQGLSSPTTRLSSRLVGSVSSVELEAQIKEIIAPFDVEGSPGGVIAVARRGVVELAVPYGYANLEHSVRNTRDTVFYIASTSKQFVAASIALLEADGLLSADDPIAKWIPEVAHLGDIRVQHLVHHTSGLRDKYSLYAIGNLPEESVSTEIGTLNLIARQRGLNFAPGSAFMYSNSGYSLMVAIVERVSGQSFIDFTNERIFGPAGMTGTRFRADTNEVIAHRASGYSFKPGGGWNDAEYTFSALGPGGVISTVDSLARWAMVYLDNPLSPADLPDRLQTTVLLTDGSYSNYAYGVMLDEHNGMRMINHAGGVAGFSAEMLHVPAEELTIVCLTNTSAGAAPVVARKVLELVLPATRAGAVAAGAAEVASPTEPIDLTTLVGSYLDSEETSVASITLEDGNPVFRVGANPVPVATDAAGNQTAAGLAMRLEGSTIVLSGGTQHFRFEPVEPATAFAAADIPGDYRSDELDVTVTIAEQDGELVMSWPTGQKVTLAPFTSEVATYVHPMGVIVAVRVRAEAGKATGLRINVMRALGTEFRKIS